jgi:type II secretory ATPase GspE/PulE/Tfp pilus assembly ATPase PilB-like protein
MTEQDRNIIGKILVNKGLITAAQLEEGLEEQKQTGEFICSLLVRKGFVDKDLVFTSLSQQIGVPYVDLKATEINNALMEKVPAKVACHYKIIPLEFTRNILTIAMADPFDIKILDDLGMFLDLNVQPVLSYEGDILEALKKLYGIGADTLEKMMDKNEIATAGETTPAEAAGAPEKSEEASVTKFVDQILKEAVKDSATDIHLEPYEDKVRVRFRIDGVLYETNIPQTIKYFYPAMVSRLKIMSNLNIAEKRLPQDGRIKLNVDNDDLDLRISILPSAFGETVHVRLLRSKFFLELTKLGLGGGDLKIIEKVIQQPHGVIFITGPTGSGKSTTLYACLSRLNSTDNKIITIEDPVEYQLEGITQMQVQPKIGFSFATGLRHILRHDPDIIMVGEVRDFETAEITIRSALTGHLVFSTLHTNDAAGSVTRLLDMGLEPFLLSSSAECFIAQRLVRLICPECKQPVKTKDRLMDLLDKQEQEFLAEKLYEGKGCPACRFTGYRGRTGIYEILLMDEAIRGLVLTRRTSQQIKQEAVKAGMHTLRQDGIRKVYDGITTLSEIIRVTSIEEKEA